MKETLNEKHNRRLKERLEHCELMWDMQVAPLLTDYIAKAKILMAKWGKNDRKECVWQICTQFGMNPPNARKLYELSK